MKKANLILELMHEMGVTLRDLMETSKCYTEGRFSLPLYIDKKMVVDDPAFFVENPCLLPKGVVIEGKIYPFSDGTEVDSIDSSKRYKSYTQAKKLGVIFPSTEELKLLADHFTEYKALAEYFNLLPFTKCVVENENNSSLWVHYYDFIEKKETAGMIACPYFSVKKL